MNLSRYDTTMMTLSGLMCAATVSHLMVKPLSTAQLDKFKAADIARQKVIIDIPVK